MKASVSKITAFQRCPKKAYYKYHLKLRRKTKNPRPLLGVIGHRCLEYHNTGKNWAEPITIALAAFNDLPAEIATEYAHIPTTLLKVLRGYFHLYREDSECVRAEMKFSVPTPGGNTIEGIMDRVCKDANGDIWLRDYKFVKQIPGDTVRFYDLQTLMYFYAAQQMGLNPVGVEFDYIRSTPPRQPDVLKNGTISRAAIDTDPETYMRAVISAGFDPKDYEDMLDKLKGNKFYQRFRVPKPDKTVASMVKDFDSSCAYLQVALNRPASMARRMCRDCSWDCEFIDLCTAELVGSDTTDMLANDFEPDIREEELTDGEE